ncbi:MAG: hypothetical protein F6J86_20750 [Symploca sp. SIO1B1]|nr:hypothetical protein [Symploca sp. SIO1B1]
MNISEVRSLVDRPDFIETAMNWQPPVLTAWQQICAERTARLHNLLLERDWQMCQQLIDEWIAEDTDQLVKANGAET